MKKNILSFVCASLLLLLVNTGCSNNENKRQNNSTESQIQLSSQDNNQIPNQENSGQAKSKKLNYDFLILESDEVGFSEELAWFPYSEGEKKSSIQSKDVKYGCVNKDGKMLFAIEGASYCPTPFENGYSHVISGDGLKVSVINQEGRIISSYNRVAKTYDKNINAEKKQGDFSNCCVAFGFGYSVIQKKNADFNSASYTYEINDPNSNSVYSFTTEELEEIETTYLGQGVFLFKNYGMFFSKSGKWVNYTTDKQFPSDINMIHYETVYDDSDGENTLEVKYLNSEGEKVSTGKISREKYGWDVNVTPVKNNISIIYSTRSNNYTIFNVSDNTLSKLDDSTYIENIAEDSEFFVEKDEAVVTMKGKDKLNYVASFDSKWNNYMMPTAYDRTVSESCKRVILDKNNVYNFDGRKLFSLSEKWYLSGAMGGEVYGYNNDVLIVTKKKQDSKRVYAVLDLDGAELFDTETIETSNLRMIELT